ncbi:MAG: ABC transporter ATP-binding protein [Candidatus Thorarchaeota archaeon]|jgi:ABC-2 type transport system ATP-binding protein
MPIIRIEEASKQYGEVVAISRFNMSVKGGSITGFVGPNGAGKTTTIRVITGLTKPDSGSVGVFGEDPFDNVAIKEQIGYVSEHDDLYSWATVRDSVNILARISTPRRHGLDDAIDRAIDDVGMAKFAERKVSALSKGMKQRTKIAAALTHAPSLLVLDEPLSGLDPLGRRRIMNLLRRLNEDDGVTILISSHVLEELEHLANRITLIHRGQTVAEGNPDNIRKLLYQYPHEIQFKTQVEDMKRISSGLVEIEGLIKSLTFFEQSEEYLECRVVTPQPEQFYDELVRLAVERKAPIIQLASLSESVERLFEFLVS